MSNRPGWPPGLISSLHKSISVNRSCKVSADRLAFCNHKFPCITPIKDVPRCAVDIQTSFCTTSPQVQLKILTAKKGKDLITPDNEVTTILVIPMDYHNTITISLLAILWPLGLLCQDEEKSATEENWPRLPLWLSQRNCEVWCLRCGIRTDTGCLSLKEFHKSNSFSQKNPSDLCLSCFRFHHSQNGYVSETMH